MRQLIDGRTIYSIYDQSGALLTREDLTSGQITDHLSLNGQTFVRVTNGTASFPLNDHLGSAYMVASATGAISSANTYNYTPFGESLGNDPGNANQQGFTGHIEDETGLTYMQARYYDPIIGRFLSADPIGYLDGLNLYAYVRNDPLNATDPDGREIKLQTQSVVPGIHHAKITIVPRNQEKYKEDRRFQQKTPDGKHFATLGAGPGAWMALVSAPNRFKNDVKAVLENDHTSDQDLEISGDEDAMIELLFSLDGNYNDGAAYQFFPGGASYNSNSYASGLLQAAGISGYSAPPNAPGFDHPLPASSFRRPPVASVTIVECSPTSCPD